MIDRCLAQKILNFSENLMNLLHQFRRVNGTEQQTCESPPRAGLDTYSTQRLCVEIKDHYKVARGDVRGWIIYIWRWSME
jgi:hypothetical protein